MKTCRVCKESKAADAFHKNAGRKDGLDARCKDCRKIYSKDWVSKTKEYRKGTRQSAIDRAKAYVKEVLEAASCKDCGIKDWRLLEFDHQRDKSNGIAQMMGWGLSTKTIREEIDKCDIVCANCHRLRTYVQRGSWRIVETLPN